MGLFSRKRRIEVPSPPSEDLLRFPKASEVKVIRPGKIKGPLDMEKAAPLPEIPLILKNKVDLMQLKEEISPVLFKPTFPLPLPEKTFPTPPERPSFTLKKPVFLRVQDYQVLLGNLRNIKNKTDGLDQTTENLEKSEFNENRDFEHLKSNLKNIHDHLLHMDDTLFNK